eukprot:8569419-Prorocentrum_lima.AAC.1
MAPTGELLKLAALRRQRRRLGAAQRGRGALFAAFLCGNLRIARGNTGGTGAVAQLGYITAE